MNDVCLLLEGSFPYVAGGVSNWVYELIKSLHDISFSIAYLGPQRSATRKMHYNIPENVIDFREFYIFDYQTKPKKWFLKRKRKESFKLLEDFLTNLRKADSSLFDRFLKMIRQGKRQGIDLDELVYSFDTWKVLERLYAKEAEDVSFIDYFWTWRFIYLPFFSLLSIDLPEAKLYHSVSTGYAGVLGAIAKYEYDRPFILTEHGIYTRERKMEVLQADWIYSETARKLKVTEERDFFKEWWIDLFSFFSRLAYDRADEIITLFEGNRKIQIREGAPPEKTRVIPNGIKIERFVLYMHIR